MADVLEHRVDREDARSPLVARGRRQRRLLEHERRAAVPPHAVEHADEGEDPERERAVGQDETERARGAESGGADEKAVAADAVAVGGGEQRREGGARQPRAHHRADFLRTEPDASEVNADQNAGRADADSAEKRGQVENRASGHLGSVAPRAGGVSRRRVAAARRPCDRRAGAGDPRRANR